jgi:extracellular elastinolytic metalloproteinase
MPASRAESRVGPAPGQSEVGLAAPFETGPEPARDPQQGPPAGGSAQGRGGWGPGRSYQADGSLSLLSAPQAGDPLAIALDYIRRNKQTLGLSDDDLADLLVQDRYVSQHNGLTHLYLRQRLNGIEVFNGDLNINVDRQGRVVNLGNGFVSNLKQTLNTQAASLSADEAVRRAAQQLGLALSEPLVPQRTVGGPAQEVVFNGAGISLEEIPVKLVIVPQDRGGARLAWQVLIRLTNGLNWWNLRVDAANGAILSQNDWIVNDTYRVFAVPTEDPADGPHILVNNPADPLASPYGWHDSNGLPGLEFTDTRGNNVYAQEDADGDNSGGNRPNGGPTLNFNFPFNPAQAPAAYQPAAITNLFYWNNILHDIHYQYGFNEASGNFQQNNYGRGGFGGDPVQADAQDGSGTDNANFATPPDAFDPRMQMFTWTYTSPDRDSDLDNGVIIHEYGHGVSNRLTGGPSNSNCLFNPEQMGEGWSDWWTLALTAKALDSGPDPRGIGTYLLGQAANGPGIRTYRYSTDMAVNPQTYNAIKAAFGPHDVGEVWAGMLWEVYWQLVDKYGFDPDFYQGNGGNNLAMQLVMDGLKLQPCNPSFVDGRDAILLADQINNGGANQCQIWIGFAKRGLGLGASAGSNFSVTDGVEAFDVPVLCRDDLALQVTVQPEIASVGGELTYALTVANYTSATLNGVVLKNPIPASTSYVPGSASDGGSESGGVVSWNLGTLPPDAILTRTFRVTVDLLGPPLFSDDMESGGSKWLVSHGLGSVDWSLNMANPHSGATAWFAPNPPDVSDQYLSLATALPLPANSVLSFWHHYATELGYDGGVVEISLNGGSSWLDLGPDMIINGYNGAISPFYQNPIAGRPAFTGNSGSYVRTVIDLASYAGQNALIRFRMTSDEIIDQIGWYVDDVRVGANEIIVNTATVTAQGGTMVEATVKTPLQEAPLLTYSPDKIEAVVTFGQSVSRSVTLRNPGVQPLNFFIGDQDLSAPCQVLNTNSGFESGDFGDWLAVDGGGTWLINDGSYPRIYDGATTNPLAGSFSAFSDQIWAGTNMFYQDINLPADLSGAVLLSWVDQWENHAGVFADYQAYRIELYGPGGGPFLGQIFATQPGDAASAGPTAHEVNVTGLVRPYAGQSVRLQIEVETFLFYFNVQIDEIELCTAAAPWVSVSPISGTIPPFGSSTVTVTFDSSQVAAPGNYLAQLLYDGNMADAVPPQQLIMHAGLFGPQSNLRFLPVVVKAR